MQTVVPTLCDQLGLQILVPVGQSVGGAMAVAAAAFLPERCVAVVTVAAQAFVEERTLRGIRKAREAFREPAQFARLTRYHGNKARGVLDGWSLDDNLKRVRCPLLAVHGNRDDGFPRQPERIGRLSSGSAEVVLLESCGHTPHREQPDQLLSAISRFPLPVSAGPAA